MDWIANTPIDTLVRYEFMQRAMLAVLLVAPLCAMIGIQVVNFRLAFFSEAVGHSAFTGVGLGLLFTSLKAPFAVMTLFGIAVAVGITWHRRNSSQASDTVIGVFSATVIAFGLCVIKYLANHKLLPPGVNLETFLLGNILTVSWTELAWLAGIFVVVTVYQVVTYNRMLLVGINAPLAQTTGVWVTVYEYSFAVLLALVVMFSIKVIGVLLVTSMLVIPAAASRSLARSAASLFWWGIGIAWSSGVVGLLASDYFSTAAGAAIVLCAAGWFVIAQLVALVQRR